MFSLRSFVRILSLCALVMTQLILSPIANATPGDFDPTFGVDGQVITDVGGYDEVLAMTIQPDGKIVAAGDTYNSSTDSSDIVLARYKTDGSLDLTFGSGGVVTTDIDGRIDIATGVALQSDGKIVVCARSQSGTNGAANDFAIVRYSANGGLDATFGVEGVVLTDFGGLFDAPWGGVAIQPNGKIVVGGTVNSNSTGEISDFGLARYNTDGSLDQAFGGAGLVVTNIENHSASAGAMVLQPDGRIVLAGGAGDQGLALARYEADGSLDPTFGVGGIALGMATTTTAAGLALEPGGKLVVAGTNFVLIPPSQYVFDFAVERLNPDGSLDVTFGAGGKVTSDIGGDIGDEDAVADVAIQGDGKIVVAGNSFGTHRIALARYNPDGSPDAGFGVDGVSLTTPFADLVAMALQPDGKIVAGGLTSGEANMALARYLGSNSADSLKFDVYWGPKHSRALAYRNAGDLSAGDYKVDAATGQPVAISGTGTLPSDVSGDATVSFDIAFNDATKKWSGTVIVNDPGAGFSATVPIHSWRFGVTRDGTTTRGVLWGFKAQSVPQKCFMFVFEIDDAA